MYLLRLAFRNLFRRRGRTFLIALILTLAVVFFLFMESFMTGLMDMGFNNVIDFETPHIEIGRREFFVEVDDGNILPLEETFIPEEEMFSTLDVLEGLVAMTPVLDFSADFIAGRYEFPVRVRSIDSSSFSNVFKNQEFLDAGEFIDSDDTGIIIGAQLAEFFDLGVGDFYTLRFQDNNGSFNTLQGDVKGIILVPNPEINLNTVFVPRGLSVPALGVEEGKISQLMIRMDNRDKALVQAGKLDELFADTDFEVRSYRDGSDLLVAMETWGFLECYFILGLFLMVGVIGIISVIVL